VEVKDIKPSAEVAYTFSDGQEVKLTVRYMGLDEVIDYVHKGDNPKPSEMNREMLVSSVLGWDLTKDGKPLPCTDENKRRYLPYVLGRKIADGSVIAWELLSFVRDEANFLGN
jgi:hypothetical protein